MKYCIYGLFAVLLTGCAQLGSVEPEQAIAEVKQRVDRMEQWSDAAQDARMQGGYENWCIRVRVSDLRRLTSEQVAGLAAFCQWGDLWPITK